MGLTSAGERDTEQSSGIVTRATQTVIVVAFEGSPDNVGSDAEGTFGLVKLANDVTYKRTKRCTFSSLSCPFSFHSE